MSRRIFIDTNVMLDLLGERMPYYDSIAKIATQADKGQITLIVSVLSFSTVFYILSKFESSEAVKKKLSKFKILSEISDLTEKIIKKSLQSGFPDFEDAMQYHCASGKDCEVLITRNVSDFKESVIPVMTPDEYLRSKLPG